MCTLINLTHSNGRETNSVRNLNNYVDFKALGHSLTMESSRPDVSNVAKEIVRKMFPEPSRHNF